MNEPKREKEKKSNKTAGGGGGEGALSQVDNFEKVTRGEFEFISVRNRVSIEKRF